MTAWEGAPGRGGDGDPWADRILDPESLLGGSSAPAPALGGSSAPAPTDLRPLLSPYLEWQRSSWPRLEEGLQSLERSRSRRLRVGSREVELQLNPVRVASTTALVDD